MSVDSRYNDAFGLFVNGANHALIPPECGGPPWVPVAVNNVHNGNPYGIGAPDNELCYQNNDCNDLPAGASRVRLPAVRSRWMA